MHATCSYLRVLTVHLLSPHFFCLISAITHKFSDRYTYDEVIKEYWEMATPEISKDILYDTYQKILQERNFAVSCSLVQVEEKSLAPLFQIHEDKNLSLNFFKALIDMEIQRCSKFMHTH